MQTFSEQSFFAINSMISSNALVMGFLKAHAILLRTAELLRVNSGVYAIFSASFLFGLDGKEAPRWEATSHQGFFLNLSIRHLVPDHVGLDSSFQPPQLIEIPTAFEGFFGEVKNVFSFLNPFIQGFLPWPVSVLVRIEPETDVAGFDQIPAHTACLENRRRVFPARCDHGKRIKIAFHDKRRFASFQKLLVEYAFRAWQKIVPDAFWAGFCGCSSVKIDDLPILVSYGKYHPSRAPLPTRPPSSCLLIGRKVRPFAVRRKTDTKLFGQIDRYASEPKIGLGACV
jgi:hypothetical protein